MNTIDDTNATITVRVIKSFAYKNFRSIVFPHVNLHTIYLAQLKEMVWDKIRNTPSLKLLGNCKLDTVKLYYQAHGAKTNNPMINVGGDNVLVLTDEGRSLFDLGFRHETEVSYFNQEDYEAYRQDPTLKW